MNPAILTTIKLTPRNPNVAGAKSASVRVKANRTLVQFCLKYILTIVLAASMAAAVVAAHFSISVPLIGPAVASVTSTIADFAVAPEMSTVQTFFLGAVTVMASVSLMLGRAYLVFAYNCFIKPLIKRSTHQGIGTADHQKRLQDFYEGQASVYDTTRQRLLRGRSTMLQVVAAQLRQHYCPGARKSPTQSDMSTPPTPTLTSFAPHTAFASDFQPPTRFAWIDIGAGTGSNVEKMHEFFPINYFAKVYVVDITPALCDVARARFQRLGWTNVTVLCADAEKFEIPKEDLVDGPMDIALITMSYSLSMIESYYGLVDRLTALLSPNGILGVVDFAVSGKRSADPARQLSWLQRWFWSMWFEMDNIYLHPARREYLEHKFACIKSLSCWNPFVWPIVYMPYYVFIGCSKTVTAEAAGLEDAAIAAVATNSAAALDADAVLGKVAKTQVVQASKHHVVSNHVHGQGMRWRAPYETSLNARFGSYIYAFVWEDPKVDLQYIDLKSTDRMLVLTSGGCNALEYLVTVGPARIHCVDLNPCQNHLLELKLAGIMALDYSDFWKLFGEGLIANFAAVLDSDLSPHLSPFAYHFWQENAEFSNLYKTGSSGLAIRTVHFMFKVLRLYPAVEKLCNATTLAEQCEVWQSTVRPAIFKSWLINVMNNESFLWNTLGVPPAQTQMLLEEGSFYDYVLNTFDPVFETTLIRNNPYYYMPMMLRYPRDSCPAYLSEAGFSTLKASGRLDAVRIHTDTILNVLQSQVADGELTKVLLMDHLDWFSEADADAEISALAAKVAVGGWVFWRSAGKHPWYTALFEKHGFTVAPQQIRNEATPLIDRVNMYCSFWRAEKLPA